MVIPFLDRPRRASVRNQYGVLDEPASDSLAQFHTREGTIVERFMPPTGETLQHRRNRLFGLFTTSVAAEQAAMTIERNSGSSVGITIVSDDNRHHIEQRGIRAALDAMFSDEHEIVGDFITALAAGCTLLIVQVANRQTADTAAVILQRAGGYSLVYFSNWTIQTYGSDVGAFIPTDEHLTERLAIAASSTIGTYLLPAVLGDFHSRYPGVVLSLTITNTAGVSANIRDGSYDCAAIAGAVDMEAKSVFVLMDRLIAIVPTGHPLARLHAVTTAQLTAEPFLLREVGSGTRDAVLQSLATRGISLRVAMELASAEAIKQAVIAGLGVAIVSELAVGPELASGSLRALRISDGPLEREFTFLRTKPPGESRALDAFLDLLQGQLRRRHNAARS